jgi:hypothetical protein
MSKKVWHEIEIECIKFNPSLTMKVGEKTIVAKVKSVGLACHVVVSMEKVYKPEYFKITIK